MPQTIVAQATATGLSGLTVIRVSGDKAFEIVDKCFIGKQRVIDAKSHTILYGNFVDYKEIASQARNDATVNRHCGLDPQSPEIIDDVTVSIFKSPNSYTGEDTVEIGSHGGNVIPMKIIETLINAGCKHAEPGEFTRRAFINKKINLVQAEAVVDLIHSISVPTAQTSARQLRGGITNELEKLRQQLINFASMLELELDFADEEIDLISNKELLLFLENAITLCKNLSNSFTVSNILRDGFYVAIVGKPNAGKSTLFNSLLNKNRSIVSEIAGTTRDYISEYLILNDIPLKIIDTAGLRETVDTVEIAGIKIAQETLEEANLILFLNDISLGENFSDDLFLEIQNHYPNSDFLLVQNKCDLVYPDGIAGQARNDSLMFRHTALDAVSPENTIYISAKNQNDLEILKNKIGEFAKKATENTNDILLNERQYFKLLEIEKSLLSAKTLLLEDTVSEIISIEIRNAGRLLGELTGETWNEEVLNSIFSRFCIGK